MHIHSTEKALAMPENLKVKHDYELEPRTKKIEMGNLLNIIVHHTYTLITNYLILTTLTYK